MKQKIPAWQRHIAAGLFWAISLVLVLYPLLYFFCGSDRLDPSEACTAETLSPIAPDPMRVDLNRATAKELEAVSGIGPVLAQNIVAYREAVGPFLDIHELYYVKGIGPELISRIEPYMIVR